ncbi:class I SAM-dependent methyltransferase [Methylomonas koyamae]|uniref:class I SAM-dependent methyltransferase n=1 Tax=Methylomonas koyamae TaxID=702114 RepID=UPI002873ADF3|nr:methyltransferase [Methylomonas koyamae]WNB77832.1 methyltransferase [Methylomonas koyamae]
MARIAHALFVLTALAACTPPDENAAAAKPPLAAAIAGHWREPANVARDIWRHPEQTLTFFQVTPGQTVIEIVPGGGWYTEILAPLLREHGQYIAAVIDPDNTVKPDSKHYYGRQLKALKIKLARLPKIYGRPEVRRFDEALPVFGKPGSADTVLTFRNVHNWREKGSSEAMFSGFFQVLKPGGILGVVEHRANPDTANGGSAGYTTQSQVIAWAEQAGFVLEAASEINANPADTKDHAGGVGSLPPNFNQGDKNRDKYAAIGESDRMTLRFRKTAADQVER